MIMVLWGKITSSSFLLSMCWTKAGRKPTPFILYLQQAESPHPAEAWHKQCQEVIMAGLKLVGVPRDVEAQRREGKNKRLKTFSTPLEAQGENMWVRWLLYFHCHCHLEASMVLKKRYSFTDLLIPYRGLGFGFLSSFAIAVEFCTSTSTISFFVYFVSFKTRNDIKVTYSLTFKRPLKIPF